MRHEQIKKATAEHIKNPFEYLFAIQAKSIQADVRLEPYIFSSVSDFTQLHQRAIPHVQLTYSDVERLIDFVGFRVNKKYPFDRKSLRFDVFITPFLLFGNYLFCPTVFYSINSWFYGLVQNHLLRLRYDSAVKTRKEESQMQEQFLTDKFAGKRWKAKRISDTEANNFKGDADVLVSDGSTLLLIQLKRTYLRLNLEDARSEEQLVVRKASTQLNSFESDFKESTNNFAQAIKDELKVSPNVRIVKWIVSTSFESIGDIYDGCRKVNYMDLLFTLNINFSNLTELIEYVEQDTLIKETVYSITPEMLQISGVGLPIPMFEEKKYRLPIFSSSDSVIKEVELFNKANYFYDKGEFNEVIKCYEECVSLNVDAGDAWGALANAYSDVKDYDKAESAFKKALNLLPQDPFIWRNYALMKWEKRDYFQSLTELLELYKIFPLLGDTHYSIKQKWNLVLANHLLNPQELIEMDKKIKAAGL